MCTVPCRQLSDDIKQVTDMGIFDTERVNDNLFNAWKSLKLDGMLFTRLGAKACSFCSSL